MGLLDRLLGRDRADGPQPRHQPQHGQPVVSDDERAVERYRYLLATAPPEQIERAHEEAFAQLTSEQRRQVLASLAAETPERERTTADDPRSLARAATRLEMRKPGTLERSFAGRGGGGMGMGSMIGGTLLASVAGAFIGSAIAQEMFDSDVPDAGAGGDGETGSDLGSDSGGEDGGGDSAGGDFAGGDFAGDFGGGDFGGGDF